MTAVDKFYTPTEIAEKMVGVIKGKRPLYIADFAAGTGELLKAAQRRWPYAQLIATDISQTSVSSLRHTETAWKTSRCDFLHSKSRQHCEALKGMVGKVSLVFLNPPFSCRGARRLTVEHNGEFFKCGLALAFVITSIKYLAPTGELVAILPAGVLHSEKDKEAWEWVSKNFEVEIVASNGHRIFNGCFPRTVIVRLQRLTKELGAGSVRDGRRNRSRRDLGITVNIIRGWVPMNAVSKKPSGELAPLIHSTELQDFAVNVTRRGAKLTLAKSVGPSVLIPRVGRPYKTKLAIYKGRKKIILSDCVIALECKTVANAKTLYSGLLKHWTLIEQHYTGTCAQYITVKILSRLLTTLGFAKPELNN